MKMPLAVPSEGVDGVPDDTVFASPFSDPLWEAAFEAPVLPLMFFHLGGRAAATGARVVAWDTTGVGWVKP